MCERNLILVSTRLGAKLLRFFFATVVTDFHVADSMLAFPFILTGAIVELASCKERWRNIRAAFARSINIYKTNGGPNRVKPYYLHMELEFLIQPMKEAREKTSLRASFSSAVDTEDILQQIDRDRDDDGEDDKNTCIDQVADADVAADDLKDEGEEDSQEFTFNDDDDEEEEQKREECDINCTEGVEVESSVDQIQPENLATNENEDRNAPLNSISEQSNEDDVEEEFNAVDIVSPPLERIRQHQEKSSSFCRVHCTPKSADVLLDCSCNGMTIRRNRGVGDSQPLNCTSFGVAEDGDAKFLEALLPDLRSMGPRQKVVFKRRIYESLEEVMSMESNITSTGPAPKRHQPSPNKEPHTQPSVPSMATTDWQRLCTVLLRHMSCEHVPGVTVNSPATVIHSVKPRIATLSGPSQDKPATIIKVEMDDDGEVDID